MMLMTEGLGVLETMQNLTDDLGLLGKLLRTRTLHGVVFNLTTFLDTGQFKLEFFNLKTRLSSVISTTNVFRRLFFMYK